MNRTRAITTGIRRARQRGAATVVIAFLLLLVLIGAVSMSVLDSGSLERDAIAEYHHLQALLIAESAVERAYYKMTTLTDSANCGTTLTETNVAMTGYGTLDITGSATIFSGASTTSACMIRAVGKTTNGQAVRTIDVLMNLATSVNVAGKRLFTCTVPSGTEALVVMLGWKTDSSFNYSISSVSFNGSAMQQGTTRASTSSSGTRASAQIFYTTYSTPTTTTSDLQGEITFSTDLDSNFDGLTAGCVALKGVDLTNPRDATTTNGAASNAPSNSLTTTAGTATSGNWNTGKRIMLQVISRDNQGSLNGSPSGATVIWTDSSNAHPGAGAYVANIAQSTPTTMTWSWTQSRAWAAAAVAMRANSVLGTNSARIDIPGSTGAAGGTISAWREVTAPPP